MRYLCVKSLLLITILLVSIGGQCSMLHAGTIDGVAAVVDDKVIMLSDVIAKARKLGLDRNEPNVLHSVLQLMVENIIVEKTCQEMGIPAPEDEEVKSVSNKTGLSIEDARIFIMKERLMNIVVRSRVVVTDRMIKDYYRSHDEYKGSFSVRLAQIVIKNDETKIKSVLDAIRQGEPFDKVALEYSDVLIHGGCDMGWIPVKDLSSEVKEALGHAKKGEVVGPVRKGEYVFIFKLLDVGTKGNKTFVEAKDDIKHILEDRYRKKVFKHWLKTISDKYFVGIYI